MKYKVLNGKLIKTKDSINEMALILKTSKKDLIFNSLNKFEGCIICCFKMSPYEVFKRVS